jgi:hypothetical protein
MSPLRKYYGALAAFVVTLMIGHTIVFAFSGPLGVVAPIEFALLVILWVYVMFVAQCPRCRKPLAARWTWYSHALPGRLCPKCGYDLSLRSKSD